MVKATTDRFGPIDILFANAGSYVAGKVAEGDPDEWDRVVDINVKSVFRVVRVVLPDMIERVRATLSSPRRSPAITRSTRSLSIQRPSTRVQSFVHGVRRQVAKHNVRIGSLAPGMVLNEL